MNVKQLTRVMHLKSEDLSRWLKVPGRTDSTSFFQFGSLWEKWPFSLRDNTISKLCRDVLSLLVENLGLHFGYRVFQKVWKIEFQVYLGAKNFWNVCIKNAQISTKIWFEKMCSFYIYIDIGLNSIFQKLLKTHTHIETKTQTQTHIQDGL